MSLFEVRVVLLSKVQIILPDETWLTNMSVSLLHSNFCSYGNKTERERKDQVVVFIQKKNNTRMKTGHYNVDHKSKQCTCTVSLF